MRFSEILLFFNRHHSNICSSGGVAGKGNMIGRISHKKNVLLAALGYITCFLIGRLGRNIVPFPSVLRRELHSGLRVATSEQIISIVPRDIRYSYDLIVAVLVQSTEGAEVDRVRKIYSRYADEPGKISDVDKDWSHHVLLVVADENAPDVGLLDLFATPDVGIFRVRARDGYKHIAEKTRALMAISEHIDFSFLVKTDSDTFPCLNHVMNVIQSLPDNLDRRRLYAGFLTKCGPIQAEGHRWSDPEFINATLGQLPCHPVYHQV